MASNTRPYVIVDAATGEGVALIDKATTPAHALRIMAGSRWFAQAASAADVLAAVKQKLPMVDAEAQAAAEALRTEPADNPDIGDVLDAMDQPAHPGPQLVKDAA